VHGAAQPAPRAHTASAPPIIGGVDDGAASEQANEQANEHAGATTGADADEGLMLAYAAGDAQAFARLYDRHERPVYRFLLRSLGNASQAEELLQETWMAVVRSAPTYAPRARFATWLYGIARSKLIDHWRAQREMVSLDADHADAANDPDGITLLDGLAAEPTAQPEVQALSKAQARALTQAVQQLPPPQREAFLLHAEAGLSLDELAELTGVGTETAKSRLRYAYARLRTLLAPWQDRSP
jgi:RNA polymerase sigma-70 factor (ECF subfamily)